MRIATDTSHPVNLKIKTRPFPSFLFSFPLTERHQETTQTAIDVQTDFVLEGESGEERDGIDRSVGEVWSRADYENGVRVAVERGCAIFEKKISRRSREYSLDSAIPINLQGIHSHSSCHSLHICFPRHRVHIDHPNLDSKIFSSFPECRMCTAGNDHLRSLDSFGLPAPIPISFDRH